MAVLLLFSWVAGAQAECFSDTKSFNSSSGISWDTSWSHIIAAFPEGFVGTSATLEIRIKVWNWPSSGRLDILCSDTMTFYASDPDYFVGSVTPNKCPNPTKFYTLTFPLQVNQIGWLTNDKSLNFIINNIFSGTYYLDYCKLTVCGSIPITYTLTLQVTGQGTLTPNIGSHSYTAGQVVNLTAAPEAGWQFTNWTGEVDDPNLAITTITINGDKTVTAFFSSIGSQSPLILLLDD